MKALASIAAVLAISGSAAAQWSDDFNRANGPIGGNWTVVSGTWAISNNQGTHTSATANEIIQHNTASLAYTSAVVKLDVLAPGSASQFSAVVIGLGGADALLVKIQDQVSTTAGFSNIGIYHRTSATAFGNWTGGTGTTFGALTAPFVAGQLKVHFSDPDTVVVEIDTDFNGTPDQTYTRTGVSVISAAFGTGYGIAGWGSTALFDNFDVSGGGPPPPANYCTAGTTTNGCLASISSTGTPSASAGSGFTLNIAGIEGAQTGIVFYGLAPLAAAWGTGNSFLCVKSPLERMGVQSVGGTFGACDGAMSVDWNAYIAGNPVAVGSPFVGGEVVYAQGWFRDPPAPKTTSLSDALQFTVQP